MADKCSITRPRQESAINEGSEDGFARGFVEPPEPPRLLGRQPQAGHLQKLSTYSQHDLLNAPVGIAHQLPMIKVRRSIWIHG